MPIRYLPLQLEFPLHILACSVQAAPALPLDMIYTTMLL